MSLQTVLSGILQILGVGLVPMLAFLLGFYYLYKYVNKKWVWFTFLGISVLLSVTSLFLTISIIKECYSGLCEMSGLVLYVSVPVLIVFSIATFFSIRKVLDKQ